MSAPPREARTLNCRTCGAAVASDQTSCAYCGARVATVACPACFGMMFAGDRHCPHCGGAASRGPVSQPTDLTCPDCSVSLATVELGPTPINECGRCAGIWLATATFDRICANADQQAAVLGRPQTQPIDVKKPWRYLPCPACRKLMQRVNFASRSGIIVDVCRAHGVWFEREELRRIVEFIRAGGMAYARAADYERLERERRRLESDQREKVQSRVDASVWGASDLGLEVAFRAVGALFDVFTDF